VTTLRSELRIRQIVAVVGGLVLVIGTAMPLIHIPIVGAISYLRHPSEFGGCEGAVMILAIAALSILLALLERFRVLWLTGMVVLAQLGATVVEFHHRAATIVAQADATGVSDPVTMWAGAMLERAHLEWGIAVVAAGALLIVIAAAWELKG
jgi:hypothetical protein